jgi:hypothetical protein
VRVLFSSKVAERVPFVTTLQEKVRAIGNPSLQITMMELPADRVSRQRGKEKLAPTIAFPKGTRLPDAVHRPETLNA